MTPWQTIAEHWQSLLQAIGIALGMGILAWLVLYVIDHFLTGVVGRSPTRVDDLILRTARLPLFLLIVLYGASRSLADLTFLPDQWLNLFDTLTYIGLLIASWFLVYRLIAGILQWYRTDIAARTSTRIDDEFIPFFRNLIFIVTLGVAIALLLDHYNIQLGPFLATLGISGFAIAFAAQATLADLIAGIVIIMDRPFRVGDFILLEGFDTAATVEDIGILTTRVVTPDERAIIMPNSRMKSSRTINYTYPDARFRLDVPLSVSRDADIAAVKKLIIETCLQVPGVLKETPPEIALVGIGDTMLTLSVRCWLGNASDQIFMVDRVNMALLQMLKANSIK